MGFNPCCCWNLKDGCVTVGIWSLVSSLSFARCYDSQICCGISNSRDCSKIEIQVYAFASLGLFGWQFVVLNECRAVTMSQANLQCQVWCPCVGTSTTATSSMIEGKSRQRPSLLCLPHSLDSACPFRIHFLASFAVRGYVRQKTAMMRN
jgi:hypothetical protein